MTQMRVPLTYAFLMLDVLSFQDFVMISIHARLIPVILYQAVLICKWTVLLVLEYTATLQINVTLSIGTFFVINDTDKLFSAIQRKMELVPLAITIAVTTILVLLIFVLWMDLDFLNAEMPQLIATTLILVQLISALKEYVLIQNSNVKMEMVVLEITVLVEYAAMFILLVTMLILAPLIVASTSILLLMSASLFQLTVMTPIHALQMFAL